MRTLLICVAVATAESPAWADPDADRANKSLQSEHFTVTWGRPVAFGPSSELEIGDGYGHAGTLGWLRFRPRKDGVTVLDIRFGDEGAKPVVVRRTEMTLDAYAQLLRVLAVVHAAKLTRAERVPGGFGTNDFWVHARLTEGAKEQMSLDWAGYVNYYDVVEYSKPQAAVALTREVTKGLTFKDDSLNAEERAWASGKFARDWKQFQGKEYYSWVRERYIRLIGAIGDSTALPALRDFLAKDLQKDPKAGASELRSVAYAITAVERLTEAPLWGPSGEDGDMEAARRKALDLLRDRK